MKKYIILLGITLLFSCKTVNEEATPNETPAVISEPAPVVVPPEPVVETQHEPEEIVVATVGELTITQKHYTETKSEIELVVDELNTITQKMNYNAWLKYLSTEYRDHFSTPSVLREVSEKLPIKGVKLNTLQDYFKYVFVPSRKNVRVDDIQFTTATRVDVIMREAGARLLVYSLEKINSSWKLVQGSK
ncbi:MAG: hypothetical protein IJU92_08210 [Spirochaetaceae bacterium]|nr:hypothetical protein [Spirochaetaceae bacterium]